MSLKHLKCETLDIHAGGRDLIFPHHENEIAQAEPLTNKPFAKYWIHHGLLTIQGQKMAKSLGNFITVQDALKKYSVDQLKMFFLSSHYASPIDFTEEKMREMQKALDRFDVLFWKAYQMLKGKKPVDPIEAEFITKHRNEFIVAMDDDFNTPMALGCLFNFINDTNKFIDTALKDGNYLGIIFRAVDTIESLSRNILGLFLKEKDADLTAEQELLLQERKYARKQKNFKRSDELRQQLKSIGIIVEDTKDGQVWRWVAFGETSPEAGMKGKFITFEGSEGSGKSTQIELVCRYLKRKRRKVLFLREPGATKIGEQIRRILLDVGSAGMSDECETLLYMAARAQLVREKIVPALRKGKVVLCDRFLDSTLAYQGYGNGVDIGWIKKLGRFATGGVTPDLTLF